MINFSKKTICLIFVSVVIMLASCENDNETREPLHEIFEVGNPSANAKKVLMHYLAWFGEGKEGRHWSYGTPRKPLIGYYSSQSWATHLYHVLLSSAVGIDGAIINVRTDYDQKSFDMFVESIKRIDEIYPDFEYSISISYDDQDATESAALSNFSHLKNDIIPNTRHYLTKNGKPVIYIWNYDGFLTSQEYRDIANTIFTSNAPILLKNDLDLDAVPGKYVMNSIYPWVQGWTNEGSNWGEGYINWFYNTQIDFKLNNKVEFVTGAVWPGFDDRNVSWGQNRWIDRKNGETYGKLWNLINKTYENKVDWVVLETWNDFNEGSEIETAEGEVDYQYLDLTAGHIGTYKGKPSLIDSEKWMLRAAVKIYQAAKLIEDGNRNYAIYYPKLQKSIEQYLKTNGQKSFELADEIITRL
ncbi:hypothetical protein [Flavobacterium ovatum]|uniref:hypothetical protein n=1 Tax=Flavobacterium ovatum TaxID=1928857 RepID=UPI00344F4684